MAKNQEEIEKRKMENLLKKAECHSMQVKARLEGSLKRNFVEQVKKQGYKQSELCREIFKFYYDHHQNCNKY
ncbi:hypothetical protein UFOVP87_25 [uncultured Caudovirales phage]|uniref:Uncharacterized protein n=1 Tax=uncultured Caudovirales phage TaxID=2100421 RepID=A0A6J5L306_9CAUD|nr:hypothetical protein UFOVP87_25 [uncultured Caudovirales phage]